MNRFIASIVMSFVLVSTIVLASVSYAGQGNTPGDPIGNGEGNKYGLLKDAVVHYIPYFYHTQKYSATPYDWVFSATSTQKNWFNELTYFTLLNTSNMTAYAYVFIYDNDGRLLNNTEYAENGIEVILEPMEQDVRQMNEYYDYISENWDGNSVIEGSIKVLAPAFLDEESTIRNGTTHVRATYVLFNGNDGTWPFNTDFRLTSYDLFAVTKADKSLMSFPMYVHPNFDNNDKVNVLYENMNYISLCNTSDDPVSVDITYFNQDTLTQVASENIQLAPHQSTYFAPTSGPLNTWINSSSGLRRFYAVINCSSSADGAPVASLVGQRVRLRSQVGTNFDALAVNMVEFKQ